MSMEGKILSVTKKEVMAGARKYIDAILPVIKDVYDKKDNGRLSASDCAKELLYIGCAMSDVAAAYSDLGIEGYTTVLQGMDLALTIGERKEKMQYAVWDKEGNLHTSDDMMNINLKGGEK